MPSACRYNPPIPPPHFPTMPRKLGAFRVTAAEICQRGEWSDFGPIALFCIVAAARPGSQADRCQAELAQGKNRSSDSMAVFPNLRRYRPTVSLLSGFGKQARISADANGRSKIDHSGHRPSALAASAARRSLSHCGTLKQGMLYLLSLRRRCASNPGDH